MKKVLAICLTMVFVVCMGATVSAAPAGFVSSPAGNAAPTLISFEALSDDCTAELKITPYSEKNTLPADAKALIEKAYDEIVGADDLADLNADLAALADGKELAVSNLFDISATGCSNHEDHEGFRIVLDVEALNRFVGILHLDGEWELLKDAKVINSGKQLEFTVDSLSPFAIVVDADANGNSPATGDNEMVYVYATVMAVSALAVLTITVKGKKNA